MSSLPLRATPDVRAATLAVVSEASATDDFATALLAALSRRPRSIAPKYFYDAAGSALFDRICELPEYYPTRTELGLLRRHAREMAECVGADAELVEFGAGSSLKVRLLLDALQRPRRFVPIDISAEHLHAAAAQLHADYPALEVAPLAADFTRRVTLPPAVGRRVGFFPGSSIGNFEPDDARRLLQRMTQWLDGGLLIGVDLVKPEADLLLAYDDPLGVTA
ncbi:MAG TPA: L-histidine N(alpha)-methyltransferase, partial [Methylibium sp.]|nr:L-histidine N(alpha)-methyltransferase [Methylibium sp.]